MRAMRRTVLLAFPLALGACATPLTGVQTSEGDVLRTWGAPTARYPLEGGAQRLEYATGPWGRQTWMFDIDATGRVRQSEQVLSDNAFIRLQQEPGLRREDVLRRLGQPGERRGARGGGETWTWRYPTNDCLWFQLSIAADGSVGSGAFLPDPTCDGPNDGHS